MIKETGLYYYPQYGTSVIYYFTHKTGSGFKVASYHFGDIKKSLDITSYVVPNSRLSETGWIYHKLEFLTSSAMRRLILKVFKEQDA